MPKLNKFKTKRTQLNENEFRELKFILVKPKGHNLQFNLY